MSRRVSSMALLRGDGDALLVQQDGSELLPAAERCPATPAEPQTKRETEIAETFSQKRKAPRGYDATQFSGVATIVRAGTTATQARTASVLRARRTGSHPLGGVCTICIHVEDLAAIPATPNARTILTVKWKSGRGGGEAQIDAGRGIVFTIGGSPETVDIDARIELANDGAFAAGADRRVEASACWGGSQSLPCYMTSEGEQLGAAVRGPITRIPIRARSMRVLTTDPASYATLQADFYTDAAGGTRVFSVLNAAANVMPVVAGAEFCAVTSSANCRAVKVFELAL